MKKLGRPIPEQLQHLDQQTPARQEAASVVARSQAAAS